MTGLPLSPPVFAILSALIEERTGLHYGLDERELLADKLTPRATELGLESLLDYYYFLRYDPSAEGELVSLADALVVNETYFFREAPALEVVVRSFVPALLAAGVRPRIWCAACATGEEPLTLAMLLDAADLLDDVTLVASDISARALARARAGRYYRRSLRALPPEVVGRWLEPEGDGMRVVPRIAAAVSWHRVNLTVPEELTALGQFDIVLCRNVLIYFSDVTVTKVIAAIAGRLRPNGWVLVGASESLLRFESALACEEHAGSFFYRKVEA
jgi:chemotaxis protein methyltransferase CheR